MVMVVVWTRRTRSICKRLLRKQPTLVARDMGLERALILKLGGPFHFPAILVQVIAIFAKPVQAHFKP